MNYAADTGTANAYAVTLSPAPTALVDGMSFWFKAKTANTGASTLNLNGIGAQPIVGAAHAPLQGSEIIANGRIEVIWNATISSWVLAEQTGGAVQVGAASQSAQAPTLCQVLGGGSTYSPDTGTANAYAAAYSPAVTAVTDGLKLRFKAKTANTGASTLNINGLGAQPIVGGAHVALQGGEIIANGDVEVVWNSTLASWVLLEQTGGPTQVAAGTQSSQAVNLGQFLASLGAWGSAGYIKLPNGLILQWGVANVTTSTAGPSSTYYGTQAVTFPIAFPHNYLGFTGMPQDAAGAGPYAPSFSNLSNTGFTQYMHSTTSGQAWNISWLAIGY